ncbi:MAG: uL15 family ribosomal protein [Candidatus Thorarchaeota archaeon]|nr:MAG: 50S ribosomal protein L15 [Candidatus Thorarchaeota archaeon]
MQKRRPKKINKMRGRRAAGYGFSAGHRASGQRGGKGMAGSKKHHYIKVMQENPRYFGKWGFKRPAKVIKNLTVINVGELDEAADRLVERGAATVTGKRYTIDVSKLGIDRILGSGKVTRRLNLVGVKSITPRARDKVTSNGGTVDLPAE